MFNDLPRFFDSLCKASLTDDDEGDVIRGEIDDFVHIASGDAYSESVKRPVVALVEIDFVDRLSSSDGTIRLAFSECNDCTYPGMGGWNEKIEYYIGKSIEPNDGALILTIPSKILCDAISGVIDPCASFLKGEYRIASIPPRGNQIARALGPFWEILTYHYHRGFRQSNGAFEK
ncbi:MAG: hypothetical protein Q6365_019390 [Candidatus Sigynarchaeota archaeon]